MKLDYPLKQDLITNLFFALDITFPRTMNTVWRWPHILSSFMIIKYWRQRV